MTRARDALDHISSPSGKLVYLYLQTRGEATVDELKEALDISQLKLYPILRTLVERELIEHRNETYRPAGRIAATA